MEELLKEVRRIRPNGSFFNATSEIAIRLHLISDPKLAGEIVQLVAWLDKLNQENYELRKQNQDEDDE